MSIWSWAKKRSEKVFAVVEIGSNAVSGAVFVIDQGPSGQKYRIVHSAHVPVGVRELEISSFLAGVERALEEVLKSFGSCEYKRPDKYFCVFSSPFYVAHNEQVVREQAEPFSVTEKLILELANKRAEERRTSEPGLYPSFLDDYNVVIESRVMQIKVNDYEVSTPLGHKTTKLIIEQYVSLGSARVISLLSKVFERAAGQLPDWHSFAYCEYSVLRDLYHSNDNFLVVDVGGEITDLSMVASGRIVDNVSFPLGQSFLVKWLAEAWPTSPTEANSLLRLYETKKLEPAAMSKFEGLLATIKKEWIGEFCAALGRAAERHIVPAKVFVIGNGLEAKIFLNWISSEDLSAFTLVPRTVDVDFMDNHVFSVFYDGNTSQLQDTFLLVDALFCGKIFKDKYFNKKV